MPKNHLQKIIRRQGRPTEPVRWTFNFASSEFGVSIDTISKRMKGAGLLAGQDGCYSTKQIATAVYGDLELERIGLTRAEKIAQEVKNQVEAGELVDVADFRKDYAPICVDMVRLIETSKLTDKEKDALREAMAGLHKA